MNDILKQRLVGALILLALGVVFWPIIFVQPPEKTTGVQQSIPAHPNVSTAPIVEPDDDYDVSGEYSPQEDGEFAEFQVTDESVIEEFEVESPEPVATNEPTATTVQEQAEATRSVAPEPLAMDGEGVPVAWILQVASVSSEDKAEKLRQRLVSMDLQAYVKTLNSGGKKLHRVYVGPKFEREKLEQLQSKIDSEFGVTSIVARYVP